MTDDPGGRSRAGRERTARLLAAGLEDLARSAGATPGRRLLDGRALALSAATRHAVALGLLSGAEAAAVWADAARRHPGAASLRAARRDIAA